MMHFKSIAFIALTFFAISQISAQPEHIKVDTTKYYAFHTNYWFNMHHFLWLEAFMNTELDSSLITVDLPKGDHQILGKALEYYRKNLAVEDLRTSPYLTEFKEWITDTNTNIDKVPDAFNEHMTQLARFHPVYKKRFWPKHQAACLEVLSKSMPIIKATEEDYVSQITQLTRQFWQEEKVHVDLTYYAKATTWNLRNRPYTSIFPTHVVMNVFGDNEIEGNWLELLYHESAHPLILSRYYFVGGTIEDIAEAENLSPPRGLWHAYLFYFTGEITKGLLTEQGIEYPSTYMERNKVFSRYQPLLKKHLAPYLNRALTLHEATQNFLRAFNENK